MVIWGVLRGLAIGLFHLLIHQVVLSEQVIVLGQAPCYAAMVITQQIHLCVTMKL